MTISHDGRMQPSCSPVMSLDTRDNWGGLLPLLPAYVTSQDYLVGLLCDTETGLDRVPSWSWLGTVNSC